MKSKAEFSDKVIKKTKEIIKNSLKKNDLNKAMSAIAYVSEYLYLYNQYYTDDDLENYTHKIANIIKKNKTDKLYSKEECTDLILVYDGFGLDVRGNIKVFLNALGLCEYNVVYVTKKSVKGTIPSIVKLCEKYNFIIEYIDMDKYVIWSEQILGVFKKYMPKTAFFYTTPFDVSGIVSFDVYDGIVDRFLIDLTDHAFWLGKCANDYFLGSRDMSATIEYYYRGIAKEKLIKLDINLLIDEFDEHHELPFDPINTKYVFSGGSLYKTLGDDKLLYYRIVDYILGNHKEISFLYAGSGDDCEMKKIIEKYPNRAFLLNERKDFYFLIENCVFYLNTYPMFGGMMMRYAAMAKKLPLTLKHNNDADGLLINQKESQIEYEDIEVMLSDIDKLLTNEKYLKERENLLEGTVISQDRFNANIKCIIEEHKSDEEHKFIKMDTTNFRREYMQRFNCRKELVNISKKINGSLLIYFPIYFLLGYTKSFLGRVRRMVKK